MARIRSIKPSVWGDDKFCDLSRDARLLFLGLISNADDKGRFIASPANIAGAVFPHDNIDPKQIKRWLAQIARTGMVTLYEVKGRSYGVLPKWAKHQRIDKPQPSTLPAPPVAADDLPPEPPMTPEDLADESQNRSANDSENRSTAEGNGGDWNGFPPTPPQSGGHDGSHQNCRDCGTNRRGPKPPPRLTPVPPRRDELCPTHGVRALNCSGCAADAKAAAS